MGDSEEQPPESVEPVPPRPVPPEDGPVTAEEVAAWCAMPTAGRMASIGRRFGKVAPDEDVLRDFYQWNLQFIEDAGIGHEKGAVVFQLLKEQRDESIAKELSLTDSLAEFQSRLLQASKRSAAAKTEAPAPEAPVDESEGVEEAAPTPVPAAATASLPPALSVDEVKLVADYFLNTFYRHYELHQAVFGSTHRETVQNNRQPPQPGPRCDVRIDMPPSTVGVLPPLAAAITEAEHFAKVEAEEQAAAEAADAAAAEAAEAEAAAEAAAMAEATGEAVPAAEEPAGGEPAAEEGYAGSPPDEGATEESHAAEPEAADTEGAEVEQDDATGEESGGASLEELLQTAVNDQMGPVRAHMDVLIKSREATLLAKMAELEAKISG